MDPNVSKQLLAVLEQVDKDDLIALLKQSANRGVGVSAPFSEAGVNLSGDGSLSSASVVNGEVRVGSDTESQASTSWSDVMEEVGEMEKKAVEAVPAVELPQYTYCEAVKKVNFLAPEVASEPGFQATYVRSPANRAFVDALADVGVKLPRSCHAELALARHSAGVLPSAFIGGRDRLKALALVGDKAMALVMVDRGYGAKRSAADLQGSVASMLSVSRLSRVFVNSGWSKYVMFPPGVDAAESRPAGEACEAVCGVIYHGCGLAGVAKFMTVLQLL